MPEIGPAGSVGLVKARVRRSSDGQLSPEFRMLPASYWFPKLVILIQIGFNCRIA